MSAPTTRRDGELLTDHQHTVSARILRDGGDAICTECGRWIWVDPETKVAVERVLVPEGDGDAKE